MRTLGRYVNVLKWFVGLAILLFLLVRNWDGFSRLISEQKDWPFLLLGFVLCAAGISTTFVRWYLLVWALEFDFTLRDAFRIGGFGLLCNYVGPGLVGGDLAKAWMIAKNQESRRAVAASTVIIDRALGLLVLFLIGSGAALTQPAFWSDPTLGPVCWSLVGGTAAGLAGFLLVLHPGTTGWKLWSKLAAMPYVGHIIGEMVNAVALYRSKQRVLFAAVLISFLGHGLMISGFYCAALSLMAWVPSAAAHFFYVPAAEIAASAFPTPAGVGALEGAVQWLYGQAPPAGITQATAKSTGLAAALAFRMVTIVISVMAASYYLLTKKEEPAIPTDGETGESPNAAPVEELANQ